MIVKLFDNTEITITKEQGDKLVANITRQKEGFVKINQMLVNKSAIQWVKPGGDPLLLERLEQEQKLKAGDAMRRVGAGVKAIGDLL